MRALAIAALLAAVSTPAFAAQGEVCASAAEALTPSNPARPLTNDVVFKCPTLGDVTVTQIYQQGWRIAHVSAGTVAPPSGVTGAFAHVNHVLVIEKL